MTTRFDSAYKKIIEESSGFTIEPVSASEYRVQAKIWKNLVVNPHVDFKNDVMKWTPSKLDVVRYVLKQDGQPKGITVGDVHNLESRDVIYICQLMAFEEHKGYGKLLLDYWINPLKAGLVFLLANPSEPESLKEFYRKMGLSEFIRKSTGNSWFYKTAWDDGKTQDYLMWHTF